MSEAILVVLHMSSWNGQEQTNLSYILTWMCIYRTMFHTVGIAHILYFWKTHCRSAQNRWWWWWQWGAV